MTAKAVSINNLSFSYSSKQNTVLSVKQWHVNANEHVFLSGASGSGKSTLLNLIAGTLSPNEGQITLLDAPFSVLSASKRDRLRAKHIGIVFQRLNLIPYLSVAENIQLAAYFADNRNRDIEEKTRTLLAQLSLPQTLLNRAASDLSVGQQQRVAIARALINSPELLIVDEPTSALDSQARDAFMQILMQTARSSAMIFVSHDTALARYFDRHDHIEKINTALNSEDSVC